MAINWNTSWLGKAGGGISGSIIGGGSLFQIDLWNMGNPSRLPVRVLVQGSRVGAVAQIGAGHVMCLVTGCHNPHEMDGLTSSGLDWELAAGVKGSALAKTGGKLFKFVVEQAVEVADWAAQESAKRLVNWWTGDFGGLNPSKREFHLLPSPLSAGFGAGLFYEWQTLHLLSGNVGWDHISPHWAIEPNGGRVRLQMYNIPEQNGKKIAIGFSVVEWGIDPYIKWRKKGGDARVNSTHAIQLEGYVYHGRVYERANGSGHSGIDLTNFQPVGRSQAGMLTVEHTSEVKKGGTLEVRPCVFKFSNYPYWTADDSVTMNLAPDGRFVGCNGGWTVRD